MSNFVDTSTSMTAGHLALCLSEIENQDMTVRELVDILKKAEPQEEVNQFKNTLYWLTLDDGSGKVEKEGTCTPFSDIEFDFDGWGNGVSYQAGEDYRYERIDGGVCVYMSPTHKKTFSVDEFETNFKKI